MSTTPTMNLAERPTRPEWFALVAALATVALHLVLQHEGPNLVFIAGAGAFWAGYVAVRAYRDRGVFRDWGFRGDNLAVASAAPAALFVAIAAAFAAYAHFRGRLHLPPHLPILLLVYPIWGIIQQFLTLGIVVRNLERVPGLGQNKPLLVFLGAAVFGAVHSPDWWTVVATFFLELALVPLYFRHRNLWPLGVLHGGAGALFYLWVLNRDLWAEHFAGL